MIRVQNVDDMMRGLGLAYPPAAAAQALISLGDIVVSWTDPWSKLLSFPAGVLALVGCEHVDFESVHAACMFQLDATCCAGADCSATT